MSTESGPRSTSPGYRIYVLTCWVEDQNEVGNADSWRFRLEDPRGSMRRGCVGIPKLTKVLCEELIGEEEMQSREENKGETHE